MDAAAKLVIEIVPRISEAWFADTLCLIFGQSKAEDQEFMVL